MGATRGAAAQGAGSGLTAPAPQVSVLPRCHRLAAVLDARTASEAAAALAWAAADAVGAIFGESRVSLAALGVLFAICLGLARGGGVGAVPGPPPPPPPGRRQSLADALAVRCARRAAAQLGRQDL